MGCNCEGKTINVGMGCCVPVLAPIENYYTKWQVDKLIEDIDVSGVTSGEVETMISSATSGLASEQWVEDQHYITDVDLSNYALKSEIPTVPTNVSAFVNDVPYLTEHQSLSGYATESYVQNYTYDKQTIDDKVAQGGSFDPSQYYNKTQVDERIASAKSDVEQEIPSLNGYATEQWVENKHYITGVDLSNYDTKSEVNTKISTACGLVNSALTSHTANTDVHVTSSDKTTWNNKSDFSGSYNDLTNKPTIPSIWSGTEAQWSQISGGTLDNNTIYLVY